MLNDSGDNNLQDFPANLAQKIRSLNKKIVPQICEFDKIEKPPFFLCHTGEKGEQHSSLFGLFFEKLAKIRLQICPATLTALFLMSCNVAELSASWQD